MPCQQNECGALTCCSLFSDFTLDLSFQTCLTLNIDLFFPIVTIVCIFTTYIVNCEYHGYATKVTISIDRLVVSGNKYCVS